MPDKLSVTTYEGMQGSQHLMTDRQYKRGCRYAANWSKEHVQDDMQHILVTVVLLSWL